MSSRRAFAMGGALGLFLVSFFVPAFVEGSRAPLGYEAFGSSVEQLCLFLGVLRSPELSFSSIGEMVLIGFLGLLWLCNLVVPLAYVAVKRRAPWMAPVLVFGSLLPVGIFFTFLGADLGLGFYLWFVSLLLLTIAVLSSPLSNKKL